MEKPGKVFYLFYFISFALKNTKKKKKEKNKTTTTKKNKQTNKKKQKKNHCRYANTSNKNVAIH